MRPWIWILCVVAACGKGEKAKPAAQVSADAAPAKRKPSFETADPAMMRPAPMVHADAPMGKPPEVRAESPDVLLVGEIRVDQKAKRVEVPARVVLEKGILEFLVVHAHGKTYESVLAVDMAPFHVQTAMLLAGFAQGDAVRLRIKLPSGEEQPVTTLLHDRATGKPATDDAWRFIGSKLEEGRFAADVTGTVVSIIPDDRAIVAAQTDRGNPYRGEKLGFEVSSTAPPVGTKVTLIFAQEQQP